MQEVKQPPEWAISVEEAGRRLGFNRKTAYKMANAGTLPGVYRIGRNWRVSAALLEEWLRSKAVSG